MELFPEIDKEATKEKANELLSNYRRLARIADEEYIPKVTASYSFEITGSGGLSESPIEKAIVRKEFAAHTLKSIAKALNKINAYQRKLIYDKYMCRKEMTDIMIYMSNDMSESTYYRELGRAQLNFAEAYENGRLLTEI